MQTHNTNGDDAPIGLNDAERKASAEHAFWTTLGTLWRRRLLITIVTGIAAVAAVVISLLIPNWYQASARLLLPAGGSTGLLAGALADLPSAAKSLLGGGAGNGDLMRYLTILESRSVADRAIEQFDLINVYETGDSETPLRNARIILQENSDFLIDDEYEFLSINVSDEDPERAAALTNFYVEELSRINSQLSAQSAANYRRFIEKQYEETEADLDSVMNAVRRFQEKYGVMDLAMQGEAFYENLATLRLPIMQAETNYERLLSEYGPDNSLVRQARATLQSANRQYREALAGQERLMPVAQDSMPMVARQFFELEKERLILSKLIQFTRPMLEEARFNEQRELEAVQVVDAAVPPERKAGPKRSIICIAATLSAFILAVLYVLLMDWWRRNHSYYAYRLKAAAESPEPTRLDPSRPAEPPRRLV